MQTGISGESSGRSAAVAPNKTARASGGASRSNSNARESINLKSNPRAINSHKGALVFPNQLRARRGSADQRLELAAWRSADCGRAGSLCGLALVKREESAQPQRLHPVTGCSRSLLSWDEPFPAARDFDSLSRESFGLKYQKKKKKKKWLADAHFCSARNQN